MQAGEDSRQRPERVGGCFQVEAIDRLVEDGSRGADRPHQNEWSELAEVTRGARHVPVERAMRRGSAAASIRSRSS